LAEEEVRGGRAARLSHVRRCVYLAQKSGRRRESILKLVKRYGIQPYIGFEADMSELTKVSALDSPSVIGVALTRTCVIRARLLMAYLDRLIGAGGELADKAAEMGEIRARLRQFPSWRRLHALEGRIVDLDDLLG